MHGSDAMDCPDFGYIAAASGPHFLPRSTGPTAEVFHHIFTIKFAFLLVVSDYQQLPSVG